MSDLGENKKDPIKFFGKSCVWGQGFIFFKAAVAGDPIMMSAAIVSAGAQATNMIKGAKLQVATTRALLAGCTLFALGGLHNHNMLQFGFGGEKLAGTLVLFYGKDIIETARPGLRLLGKAALVPKLIGAAILDHAAIVMLGKDSLNDFLHAGASGNHSLAIRGILGMAGAAGIVLGQTFGATKARDVTLRELIGRPQGAQELSV